MTRKGQESTTAPVAPSSLAFAPLAYPTIVTPYGIAVLVVLVSASNAMVTEILALTPVVLVRDLLAMLFADRILKTAFVASSLNNAGAGVGVLQVALGVEVMVFALRLLGVVDPGAQHKPSDPPEQTLDEKCCKRLLSVCASWIHSDGAGLV